MERLKTYKIIVTAILMFAACSDSKSVEELTILPDTGAEMNHLAECEAWKAIPGGVTQYVDPKIGSGGHGHVLLELMFLSVWCN